MAVYRREGSDNYWLDYYDSDGRRVRVSADTSDYEEARRRLKTKQGKAASGEPVISARMTWDELSKELREYYKSTGKRDLKEAGKRLKHLDPYFKGWRIDRITSAAISAYIVKRQAEPIVSPVLKKTKLPANGTVNREISVLLKALKLAVQRGRLTVVPKVDRPKEADARAGFFERDAFAAVRSKLSEDLQVAVSIAYEVGWRTQSEVLTRELRHLNLEKRTLVLDPGETKNGEGRLVILTPELTEQLRVHVERVHELARSLGQVARWLFPHFPNPHVRPALVGTRRRDFRKAWISACKAAGYPTSLRHDMRRSAVRNMVNDNVNEKVAMTFSGHKTRSVFDRYHIVSEQDLQNAAAKRTPVGVVTVSSHSGTVTELRRKRKDGTTGT
jgi:integrase